MLIVIWYKGYLYGEHCIPRQRIMDMSGGRGWSYRDRDPTVNPAQSV